MIIGIAGKMHHGKDTAAFPLIEDYGFDVLRFADGLKVITALFLDGIGYDSQQVEDCVWGNSKGYLIPYFNKTSREIQQIVGEFGRSLNKDLWADITVNDALKIHNKGHNVVIPDVRFPNEADKILQAGGFVIRVVNPRIKDNEFSNHNSETQVMGLNTSCPDIINDGSIEELQVKLVDTVRKLVSKD